MALFNLSFISLIVKFSPLYIHLNSLGNVSFSDSLSSNLFNCLFLSGSLLIISLNTIS